MNEIERTQRTIADGQAGRNASIALDCPWCAEPLRIGGAELFDGTVCPACCVEIVLDDTPIVGRTVARPLAA